MIKWRKRSEHEKDNDSFNYGDTDYCASVDCGNRDIQPTCRNP